MQPAALTEIMNKSKKTSFKLSPQHKKPLAIGAVIVIVLVFAGFLLSLTSGSKSTAESAASGTTAAAQNQGTSGELQVPASQRYDYANLLNDPSEEAIPLVQPEASDDPFAGMKNQTPARTTPQVQPPQIELPSAAPAPAPAQDPYYAGSQGSSSAVPQPEPQPQAVQTPRRAIMYCDSFSTAQDAETQKAMIAFQGIVATVVPQGQTYSLRIGPFPNREAGRQVFSILSDKGLVRQCALSDY